MTKRFEDFLKQVQVDFVTIQQVVWLYLVEQVDDMLLEEMLIEMRVVVIDLLYFDEQLKRLERDSGALTEIASDYLAHQWEDEQAREQVENVFQHTKGKLPVIEVTMLTIALMYGMYPATTGGVTEEETSEAINADGSRTKKKRIKREPFGPIGSAVASLFGKG